MNLFRKRNTIKNGDVKNNDLQNSYLENISRYIRYSREIMKPLSYDKDNQEYDIKSYTETINHLVEYLRSTFTTDVLKDGSSLELDVKKMCEGIDNAVIYSLYEPKFRDIIYILSEEKYPHFHTNGKYVLSAEGINCMPGLNVNLRKYRINEIFEGFDMFEARDLLRQMKLLPPNNNLEREIHLYEQATMIHKDFILSVVYNLLMSGEADDIVRARLFADSFGIDFDFKPYEGKDKEDTRKLCMGMKESTGC